MSNKTMPTEKDFQEYIVEKLKQEGRVVERNAKTDYDKLRGMDTQVLLYFLNQTQLEKMEKLRQIYGEQTNQIVLNTINQKIVQTGLLSALHFGVEVGNVQLDLIYEKPATTYNPDLTDKYNKNIVSIMQEVYTNDGKRVDLVEFINGLVFITDELKYGNHQSYRDAIEQYRTSRNPNDRMFLFKSGAVVNFAMDQNECYMTTQLKGKDTVFLPFNRGKGLDKDTGAGNPENDGSGDYPTHYMWDDVLTRESIIELATKFAFVKKSETINKKTKRKEITETLVFPRYHQRDAVQKIVTDIKKKETRDNYLIEHAAGSGKTNTIMWLAHQLAPLHGEDNKPKFDTILVVTDRIVADRQLQAALRSIDHKNGLIKVIDEHCTSEDLEEALKRNYKIIVVTIQKFLYVARDEQTFEGKNYGIIIDEAHSSTAGKNMAAVHKVLGASDDGDNLPDYALDLEDEINAAIGKHGKRGNISFIAFTATPKSSTLRLFGIPVPTATNIEYVPFHLYSMKQSQEEGYTLDVLQNYTVYKTYYQIVKKIEDDPVFDSLKAKQEIARIVETDPTLISLRMEVIGKHFLQHVEVQLGGHGKGLLPAPSREAAVRYFWAVQKLIQEKGWTKIKPLVAFSGTVTIDGVEYTERSLNGFSEEKLPAMFDTDQYNLLIVANKYQVGFDQPKLCGLYICKKLQGVHAVQTLERANRPYLPYEKQPVILDFVNEYDTIEAAFSPYYTVTALNNTVSEEQLYTLAEKIDEYNFLMDADVEKVAETYHDKNLDANTKGKRINACLLRAEERIMTNYTEDDQKAIRMACKGFIKVYNFFSLVSSFKDAELYKKHLFLDLLLGRLYMGNAGTLNIKDKIHVEQVSLECKGNKGTKEHKHSRAVFLSQAEVKLTETEEKQLSEIIAEINARAGRKMYDDVVTKSILQIKDILMHSEDLRASAQSNSEEAFAHSYYNSIDQALIDGREQNKEFFTALLNDDKMTRRVLGIFLSDVYQNLRKEGEK